MEKHHLTRGLALAAAVLVSALASDPHEAWAKHRKSQPQQSSSDPCAGPTGFVKQNIAKIQQLQASDQPRTDNLAGWIQHLQGTKSTDPAKLAKISELRHDAEGVNSLLKADGCPMVDIELELNPKSGTTGTR